MSIEIVTKLIMTPRPGCIAYQFGHEPLDVSVYFFKDWSFANRGGKDRSEIPFVKRHQDLV